MERNKNKNKRKSSLAFGKTVLSTGNHKLSHVLGILRIINESIILACQAFEGKRLEGDFDRASENPAIQAHAIIIIIVIIIIIIIIIIA